MEMDSFYRKFNFSPQDGFADVLPVGEDLEAAASHVTEKLANYVSDQQEHLHKINSTDQGVDPLQVSTWRRHHSDPQGYALVIHDEKALFFEVNTSDPEDVAIRKQVEVSLKDFSSRALAHEAEHLLNEFNNIEDFEIFAGMIDKSCARSRTMSGDLDANLQNDPAVLGMLLVAVDNPELAESLSNEYTQDRAKNLYESKEELEREARRCLRRHAGQELGTITLKLYLQEADAHMYVEIEGFRRERNYDHQIANMRFLYQDGANPIKVDFSDTTARENSFDEELSSFELDATIAKHLLENGNQTEGMFARFWENAERFYLGEFDSDIS